MMDVYCLCLEEGAIAHTRYNISSCNVPCPNDIMMNTCGNKDSMSVCKLQITFTTNHVEFIDI